MLGRNVNSAGQEKIYFWCFFMLSNVVSQEPSAILPQGRIVGTKAYAKNSLKPIEIFYGIPYATPPTGRYRFSAPEKHTGWGRTFYANRLPRHCPQHGDGDSNNFSEDCLFLNIWTPRRSEGKSLPVVVILYSESWLRGGTSLPCQELAAEGLIVVTVAYRLHMLAFFTMRTTDARGNLALLDQYLALLWVRENIATFGGDPIDITLLGHSAGADSILYHIASPRSVGLFHRAILMSPRYMWKAVDNGSSKKAAQTERVSRDIARSLRCVNSSDHEILQCLRSRDLSEILSLHLNTNWSDVLQPISDDFLPESEQFLPISLPAALSVNKQPITQIDLLFGTNDLESINYNDKDYEEMLKHGAAFVSDYANSHVIPELLKMFSLQESEALPMLMQAIRWEYWKGKENKFSDKETLKAIESVARMESSAKWSASGALLAAKLARRVGRLYVYRFSQPAGVDLTGRQLNFTGAAHGTDLVALFGDALMLQVARRAARPEEHQIASMFRKYIVNFIKYGSPGQDNEWQRYRAGDAHVFDINSKKVSTHSPSKDAAFWLQYLPSLSNLFVSSGRSEGLTSEKGESRMRGGVFAMTGVSSVLLLLLCACLVLLRRERVHRSSAVDDIPR